MNNIEVILYLATIITASSAVILAIKTLVNIRKKSVDDFMQERIERRKKSLLEAQKHLIKNITSSDRKHLNS